MRNEVDGIEQRCPGCGGRFAAVDGPTHAYMLSTPGCWAAFSEILAREFQDPALFARSHQLSVDAYALQHPGAGADRRATQSVWVHYTSLFLILEEKRPFRHATAALKRLAGRSFASLDNVPESFETTARDVVTAGVGEHEAAVLRWARCAYEAWPQLEAPTRAMLARLG